MRRAPLTISSSIPLRYAVLACALVLAACGDDEPPPDPPLEPTYENVEMIVRQSCTFTMACHGGTMSGRGRLNFQRVFDDGRPITDVLFEVPACEYSPLLRVKPGVPAESWLWIKVDGATDGDGNILFTPDPSWDAGVRVRDGGLLEPSTCPNVERGVLTFGRLMPMGSRSGISPNRRKAIYEWILAGAPGPGGAVTMRDAGPDFGPSDLGPSDMSLDDASSADAGAADAAVDLGSADAGSADADAGVGDAGVPVGDAAARRR